MFQKNVMLGIGLLNGEDVIKIGGFGALVYF